MEVQSGFMRLSIKRVISKLKCEPYIEISMGHESLKMKIDDAVPHALNILEHALMTLVESQFMKYCLNDLNLNEPDAGILLSSFRDARQNDFMPDLKFTSDGGSIPVNTVRNNALSHLSATFHIEAEAYLKLFLMERMGKTEEQASKLVENFQMNWMPMQT